MQLERNTTAPSCQISKSDKLFKTSLAPCSSNHGHIYSKWYVLMFG